MKTSKKPGAAERNHYMQDLHPLHCLWLHHKNWGKPRVTHSKKQGKFVLEAEGREVFPLGAH